MIVSDTNVSIYLALDSQYTDAARALYSTDPVWIAPRLWQSEVRQVLIRHVRQSLITVPQARFQMARLEVIFEGKLYTVRSENVLELAANSGCSAYDCEFVELARSMACPLVTMDRKLARAFPDTAQLLMV